MICHLQGGTILNAQEQKNGLKTRESKYEIQFKSEGLALELGELI